MTTYYRQHKCKAFKKIFSNKNCWFLCWEFYIELHTCNCEAEICDSHKALCFFYNILVFGFSHRVNLENSISSWHIQVQKKNKYEYFCYRSNASLISNLSKSFLQLLKPVLLLLLIFLTERKTHTCICYIPF